MQFDTKTIAILRNFSSINPSVIFKPGNVISTISPSRSILAKATIPVEIESEFAIYDLSQFLGALSMFDTPDLTVTDTAMQIRKGGEKINYRFASPSLILSPPEKEVNIPAPEITFDLKEEVLTRTLRALSVIGCPELAVTGEDGIIYLEAINIKNDAASTYRVEVGTTTAKFRQVFLAENIKLIPCDYRVNISSRGIANFAGADVQYWISTEPSSTYSDS